MTAGYKTRASFKDAEEFLKRVLSDVQTTPSDFSIYTVELALREKEINEYAIKNVIGKYKDVNENIEQEINKKIEKVNEQRLKANKTEQEKFLENENLQLIYENLFLNSGETLNKYEKINKVLNTLQEKFALLEEKRKDIKIDNENSTILTFLKTNWQNIPK